MVDEFEFAMRFQQSGVGADGVDPHSTQGLGGADEHVGHRAIGKIDHQVVNGVSGSALHNVQRQDVGPHRPQRDGKRTQAAGAVFKFDTQQI